MGKVIICAGHGGADPGAIGAGVREADICTRLRDETAAAIRRRGGIELVTDGAEGENLTFEAALALQKTQLWNLALEIHNNAHIGPARGVEVVSPSKAFDLFSRDLASSVAAAMGTLVRHPYSGGVIRQQQTARGRLGWVRQGGVLLEAGFITHPQDRAALIERPVEIGEAIAAAIFRFVLPPK